MADEVGGSSGPREVIWFCKIGATVPIHHSLNDRDMRVAVEREFRLLAGADCEFIFSGMGEELTEGERAVVEDREPDFFKTGYAEECLHEVRERLRQGEPLPPYTPEQWVSLMMIKLGQAAVALVSDPEEPQPDTETGRLLLLAVASAALDAWEALRDAS